MSEEPIQAAIEIGTGTTGFRHLRLPAHCARPRTPAPELPHLEKRLRSLGLHTVVQRLEGAFVATGRGAIPVGATYPAVAWLLQQRMFSVDEVMARYPFLDESEFQAVLQTLLGIGALVAVDMR